MTWLLAEYAVEPGFVPTVRDLARNRAIIRSIDAVVATERAPVIHARELVKYVGSPPCGKPHCCYTGATSIYHCSCKECHG